MTMELLREFCTVPISSILNYVILGCTGIVVSFMTLSMVFERRHAPLVFWAYFVFKSLVDGVLWYAIGHSAQQDLFIELNGAWKFVTAIVSLCVVLYTFKGDYVNVGVCACFCDSIAAVLMILSLAVVNIGVDAGYEQTYLSPLSWRTAVSMAGVLLVARLLRDPVGWTLRFLGRAVMRNQTLWALGAVLCILVYSSGAEAVTRSLALRNNFLYYAVFIAAETLAVCLVLLLRLRDLKAREKTVAACMDLASRYDQTVREHLAVLDRDRAALVGHEAVLGLIGDDETDDAISGRIVRLEQAYRGLASGNFCSQPALDAVLTSGAERLRARGIEPRITVAGVLAGAMGSELAVLTLLDLALNAAGRTASVEGSWVELRLRGRGEQVLLRLEVPATWGLLGARRFLAPLAADRTMLVRERRHGDRTVVLVLEGVRDV